MGVPFCGLLGLTYRSICTYIRKRENASADLSFVVGEGKTAVAGRSGFVD
jgi:hypothetical protein